MPRGRAQQEGPRTEEQRERDRLERERRRAQRAGSPAYEADPAAPISPSAADAMPPAAEAVPPAAEAMPPTADLLAPADPVAPPTEPALPVDSPPPPDEPPPARADPAPPAAAAPPIPPPASSPRPSLAAPPAIGAAPARKRRSPLARLLAVGALVIVGVAVWLAVRGHGSSAPPARPASVPVVERVLIPEGETRLQIATRARRAGLTGSYLSASVRSALLNPRAYGAPRDTPNLEGFLFPATYEIYRGSPAGRLVHEQLIAFHERFGDALIRRARALHETPYDLLIVASIVEREAQLAGDRPKVAAVIYNRLRAGMPLGVDATIRYALNDYSQPLTAAQLALSSPYNTRLHRGLPPTPISNPGLASIEAAAHPAHVSYLYYVAGADGCGEQVFSNNIEQFERDAAAYREAIARNGGHVPSCRSGH